jgi:hypothetical protein
MPLPGIRQCKAKSKNTGQRCQAPAMHGQLVCFHHGGSTPRGRAAGARRQAEEEAQKVLLTALKDAPPMEHVGEVYDELLAVAGATRAWRKILTDRVAALERLSQRGLDTQRVAVDVKLFERALERSAKVAEAIARLNLEERKAALDERTAGAVAACITAILSDLQLTPEQQQLAQAVAPKRLRELTV